MNKLNIFTPTHDRPELLLKQFSIIQKISKLIEIKGVIYDSSIVKSRIGNVKLNNNIRIIYVHCPKMKLQEKRLRASKECKEGALILQSNVIPNVSLFGGVIDFIAREKDNFDILIFPRKTKSENEKIIATPFKAKAIDLGNKKLPTSEIVTFRTSTGGYKDFNTNDFVTEIGSFINKKMYCLFNKEYFSYEYQENSLTKNRGDSLYFDLPSVHYKIFNELLHESKLMSFSNIWLIASLLKMREDNGLKIGAKLIGMPISFLVYFFSMRKK